MWEERRMLVAQNLQEQLESEERQLGEQLLAVGVPLSLVSLLARTCVLILS